VIRSAGGDPDDQFGGDAGVQLDGDLVRADGLDVTVGVDGPAVEHRTADRAHLVGDLDGGDGAEQFGAVTGGAGGDGQLLAQRLQSLLDLVGVLDAADLTGQLRALDGGNLLLRTLGRARPRSE
jgi:hypothetical protein